MLTVAGLSKSFGGRELFDNVSFTLQSGERIGLVGPNGAGKSTLIKIILGKEEGDTGAVTFNRGTRIGYLPQEGEAAGEETVMDIAVPHEHEHDGQFVAKAKQMLDALGFKQSDHARPAKELSGGWVMRAHLARLLTDEPELLLLDEPTNHLDLETLLWFQDFLQYYAGGILLISHDREFLNALCTHIAELRSAQILRYTGNYDNYLVQRAEHEKNMVATAKAQQRKIDQLQVFADRFRAKASMASQAQSKLKQIERLKEEMVEVPGSSGPTVGFRFPQPQRSGQRVITLEKVKFGYGEKPIYENLNFEAERGQRTVLVGPNGAGKSTLLKLLAEILQPQGGTRELGHNVKAGYFAQHRAQMLNPRDTVLQAALDTPQRVTEQAVRTILGSFLFRGDDVFKPVSVLSGGEKSRLALVKLLLDPPNLLLMDEPTTHLDLASVDALIEALKPYEGTIIFISHDVHFIRTLATHVVRVEAGVLRHYPGGYQYYLDKTAQTGREALTSSSMAPVAKQAKPQLSGADRKAQKRLEAEQRQARSSKRQEIQKRVTTLEKEIADLETMEKQLTEKMESPETHATPGRAGTLNREIVDIHERLKEATMEWEAAGMEMERFQADMATEKAEG
ncbi:MAG TPA: ABC-F family ATP-binding cassette domain-containing protein [Verrucomicrobiae bacterium]|nr:ABC-F family ATP-binding cassette domain-containing protein [Verrucomicrobiae bacterium]